MAASPPLTTNVRVRPAGHSRAGWLRSVVAGVVPTLIAFVVQWFFEPPIARWALFYPAVFIGSWFGGFRSGVISTLLSSVLVWWYFIPPERTWGTNDPTNVLAAIVFLGMGIAMSVLQGRMRRLVQQLRLFGALVENSTDFIGMADADGNVFYINPAGRAMIGLSPDAPLINTKTREFYPEAVRSSATEIGRDTLEKGHWEGTTHFRHWQSGAEIPVWQNRFVIHEPGTKHVLAVGTVTRDLTEVEKARRALESANQNLTDRTRALAESQRLLQAIMDFSPSVIIVKDLAGRYQLINRRLEEMLGISTANAVGKTDSELFPPALAANHRKSDAAVLEHGEAKIYEEVHEYGDNRRVFLINKFPLQDANDAVFAIGAIWSDITERKRTEEALLQRETDLRAAERIAHLGSWAWTARGDTVRWSDEMFRIFGMDPSLPAPRALDMDSRVFTEESVGRLRSAVNAAMSDGTPFETEVSALRPDRSMRHLAVRGVAVREKSGAVSGVEGTMQDITELREAEQLRDEWTSVIAHDLRQPIGVILMAASALPEMHKGEVTDDEKLFVSRIVAAGNTLARMVDDLLDLSLLEAHRLELQRRWVNPRDFVSETVGRLAHITAGHPVRFSQEGGVGDVFVDPMRIGQVLGNLTSNAVKYGEPGTDIDVRLAQRDHEVEISVTNHGRGISPEDMPRLFSRFMRSKQTRTRVPGLGVGLYISRELVEAHQGRIWAESTPGKTTTFHLTLPARVTPAKVA